MTRFKAPRLGWHLLLALLMLLMQQGALRHGVQHIKGEDGAPTHTLCKDCLSFHAAEQALAGDTAPALLHPALTQAPPEPGWASHLGAFRASYRSRAPPVLSA
ncbi:hypothetical protein [Aquabacterium sp.]|uniref:hypothetical protein n=1 Tax=Aquabacterium sp. TaxID=1872578 RepID=UPI0025BDC925|nr:hypothetical protein [Aquabacterium sp.]